MNGSTWTAWFSLKLGFSFIGLIFLLSLFIPNLWFALHAPSWQTEMDDSEPALFLIPERLGQISVTFLMLCTGSLKLTGSWEPWDWWLAAAAVLMGLYLAAWIRFFAGGSSLVDFYRPFLGIPLPLAALPVAAALSLGIYARSFWLVLSGAVLCFGHIGIHLQHWRTVHHCSG